MTSPPPPGPGPNADAIANTARIAAEQAVAQQVGQVATFLAGGGLASDAVDDLSWQVNRLAEIARLRRQLALSSLAAQKTATAQIPAMLGSVAQEAAGGLDVQLGGLADELVQALTSMWDRTPALLTGAAQTIVSQATAQVRVGNLTRVQATAQAADRLVAQGIAPARDRAGRQWTAPAYTEMRVRTGVMDAGRTGRETQAVRFGTPYVQVSDALRECPLCLIPGTIVEGPVPTGRTASEYSGDVVRIVTASGKDLTGTPDHPVLTPHGWVALKHLRPGDKVISNTGQKDIAGVVPDHVDVPTRIEEVGESVVPLLLASPARRELDSNVSHREVRAVIPDGHLLTERDLAFLKPISDLLLVGGVSAASPFLAVNDGADDLGRPADASYCLMCGVEHGVPLLGGSELPAESHGLGSLLPQDLGVHLGEPTLQTMMAGPSLDTSPSQVVSHGPSADTENGAELLRSLAGYVAADEVISVGRRQFRGHVWDLSTEPSWFVANGIVTHNCRPFEGKVLTLDGTDPEDIAHATLAEARAAGLGHPNCRHLWAPYFPGVSSKVQPTPDPSGWEASKRQRELERRVRREKLRQQTAETIDPGGMTAAAAKTRVREAQRLLREHVKATGQRRKPDRERVPQAS